MKTIEKKLEEKNNIIARQNKKILELENRIAELEFQLSYTNDFHTSSTAKAKELIETNARLKNEYDAMILSAKNVREHYETLLKNIMAERKAYERKFLSVISNLI